MTHDELRAAAERLLDYTDGPARTARADDIQAVARGLLSRLPPADDAELVSAAAMRQEPGWTQGMDDNCFWQDGVLGTLRVWPNTGCVEFGNYVLVRAGATLGDIRKLAAVLCNKEPT